MGVEGTCLCGGVVIGRDVQYRRWGALKTKREEVCQKCGRHSARSVVAGLEKTHYQGRLIPATRDGMRPEPTDLYELPPAGK